MSKKRPAASIASLEREIAKLKKENAELRGEDPKKKPRVGRNAKEAYVTCLLLGQEYPFSFEMDDFGANSTDELHASFRENLRDGKEIEFTLKGGKKVEANLRVWSLGIAVRREEDRTKLLSVPALWRTTLALLHVDDDVGSAAEAQLRPLAARNRPWQAIRSCADASAWPCALELLERWRSRADLRLGTWTYSSTIVACGRGDQWQHSMAVLSRMEEVRLSADLIAMSATISSCAAAAQWQRALRYLVELPQAKLEADAMTYHAVTSALVKLEKIPGMGGWKGESLELAMKLLEQMSSASMANESWKTRDETCAKEVTYSRVIHLTVSREDDEDKADKFGSPGQAEGQRPVWATDQRNGQRIEVTPTYSVAVHGRRAVAAALGASSPRLRPLGAATLLLAASRRAPLRRPSASRTAGTAVLGSASSSAPPGLVEALAQAGLGGTAASEAALRHVAERRAEELVEHLEEVVGEGKLLDAGWLQMGKEEIRKKLAEIFTGYLLEIHQIVQVSDVFNDLSVPCRTWRRPWADALVAAHHARQLWAPHLAVAQDFSQLNALGLGCIVLDGMVPPQLAADAHAELEQMAQDGKLSDFSQSTCNPGSRHLWLRFAGPGSDGDGLVPPALATLGDALAGLPGALEERAREVQLSSPRLRIVPNLMAATYGPGSHYVPHKDMYSGGSCGFENTGMLTILCYLNPHWRPGDGGELRVFNTLREAPASPGPGRRVPELLQITADHSESTTTTSHGEAFVDVEPLLGRIVIFRSREVWHGIQPSKAPRRWAVTLWVLADGQPE
ncbi:unnamed protein product [Durusdinium trenchii]|uniref:Fe2OG dioxygenase domain-containing protein n=1 Tax=Durusdinium trenchii TaxID=1381693 RepID=A0ABP0MIC2_9DINO